MHSPSSDPSSRWKSKLVLTVSFKHSPVNNYPLEMRCQHSIGLYSTLSLQLAWSTTWYPWQVKRCPFTQTPGGRGISVAFFIKPVILSLFSLTILRFLFPFSMLSFRRECLSCGCSLLSLLFRSQAEKYCCAQTSPLLKGSQRRIWYQQQSCLQEF